MLDDFRLKGDKYGALKSVLRSHITPDRLVSRGATVRLRLASIESLIRGVAQARR